MTTTTNSSISPRTNARASRRFLERGRFGLVTELFGQFDPQPQNATLTVKWRRYESLARATSPLAEGVTPTAKQATFTDVTAVLQQYGDLVKITDVIQDTHEDPVLQQMTNVLAEQAGDTIEVTRISFLKAGSNVVYSGGVSTRATVDGTVTAGDLKKIYRAFKRKKAKEISEIVSASMKISTEPIQSSYFAMGSTDLDADIRNVSGFVPVAQYSNSAAAMPFEIGSVGQTRFILTPLFLPWEAAGASSTTWLSGGVAVSSAASADVYPLIVVARDGYGIVPLAGKEAVQINVVQPNVADKADPMAQFGFISWKMYQTGAILNQNWVTRYEVAATANPS